MHIWAGHRVVSERTARLVLVSRPSIDVNETDGKLASIEYTSSEDKNTDAYAGR